MDSEQLNSKTISKWRIIFCLLVVGIILILLAYGFIKFDIQRGVDRGLIESGETGKLKIIGLIIIIGIIFSSFILCFAFEANSKLKKRLFISLTVIPSALAWAIYFIMVNNFRSGTRAAGGYTAIYGFILAIFYLIFSMILYKEPTKINKLNSK